MERICLHQTLTLYVHSSKEKNRDFMLESLLFIQCNQFFEDKGLKREVGPIRL